MLAALQSLNVSSTRIYNKLPSHIQPAFFQLVYHPVHASLILTHMYIAAGLNNLHAWQGRVSANDYLAQVEDLFEQDYALELDYHGILDGK